MALEGSAAEPCSPANTFARRWGNVLGILLFTLLLVALSVRQSYLMVIPGEPARSDAAGLNGLADFQDVIYVPLHAVRDGVNPYDCGSDPRPDGTLRYRQRYPALNLFPLYSPLLFVLYWPFGYGDFVASGIAYMALNVGLLLGFAHYCWRCAGIRPTIGHTTLLATAMLATQAGRSNFLGGETALALALGSLAAVKLAPRYPWLAGMALALTSFKPTFGLPLGILLLACGYYRTVAVGWSVGFVAGVAGLLLIFSRSGDLPRMPEILLRNQQVLESDPDADAKTSAMRVDSAGAIERWLPLGKSVAFAAPILLLGIACSALWQLRAARSQSEAELLTIAIVALTTVSCMYHITYDSLLVWAAIVIVGLAPCTMWPKASQRWRWCVAALLFVPMINLLGTKSVVDLQTNWLPAISLLPTPLLDYGWRLVCTLNGIALLAALCLLAQRARQVATTMPRAG